MKKVLFPLAAAALAALAGCVSYETRQSAYFLSEDGELAYVEFQHGDGEHVNYYYTGETRREFKSKLRVRVEFGKEKFTAYQCLNVLPSGTMYRSDDEEWLYHAHGAIGTIYRQIPGDYREVFQGVMQLTPKGARQR